MIDSSLSFDCHVENLCNKLASRIGVLSIIRPFLSLKQRLLLNNVIIRLVMSYADVIWSSCDKEPLYRVLKLQKRASRIISYSDHLTPSLTLSISWDGYLFMNSKINKCVIFQKRVNGSLPNYLNEHLTINNTQHNGSTRYASHNSICPYYKRETEGGRSFAVSATRLWNNVPLNIRKSDSVESLKTHLFQNNLRSTATFRPFKELTFISVYIYF